MTIHLFWPASTVSTVATTTSAATALGYAGPTMRIVNVGSETVYVKFGSSDVTVTVSTGMPVLPGTVELFKTSQVRSGSSSTATHVATITNANTSRISITMGEGDA